MSIGEAIRRSTETGWVGAFLLMLGMEVAIVLLFVLESMIFSLVSTPDTAPSTVVNTEIMDLCVSRDGANAMSIMRTKYGDRGKGLKYSVVLHSIRVPEGAAVIPVEHGQPQKVVYSPVDDLAAIGCDDGSLYLLNPRGQSPTPQFLGRHPCGLDQIAFSPDGRLLVALDEFTLHIWNVASGTLICRTPTVPEAFRCLTFLPDSQHILLGDYFGAVYIGSIEHPARPTLLAECCSPALYLACSPDGRRAAAVGVNGVLHVWDLDSKRLLWRRSRVHRSSLSPAVFSADSRTIMSGLAAADELESESVAVMVWDAETGEPRGKLVGHTGQVRSLAISGAGLLHSGSRDGTVRTWDLRSRTEIQRFSADTRRSRPGGEAAWSLATNDAMPWAWSPFATRK
jgi:WD40 repeat protein